MEELEHGHGHKPKHHHHRDRHHHRHHHKHRRNSSDSNLENSVIAAPPPVPAPPLTPVKEKNFKLLVDPCLVKGAKKLYRFDGIVAGDPSWNVTVVKDPRQSIGRRWIKPGTLDLSVPRFKIDSNYVGDPPQVEITISNLNDNIDRQFLTDLVIKFGEVEEVIIYYHPVTNKHSGIARVVFIEVSSAHTCVATLNSKSVMGKQLVVFLDPFGKEWMRMIDHLIAPKKDFVPPEPEEDPSKHADKDKNLKTKLENDSGGNIEEQVGGSSPFSHKTPACNPSPVTAAPTALSAPAASVPPFPPPPLPTNVAMPDFNRPPPMAPGSGASWPVHNEWINSGTQWRQTTWGNSAPSFMSPPPAIPIPPTPAPTEKESKLDLDTRIELLLKGGINGMAPPFLALDMDIDKNEGEEMVSEKKPARSRSTSVSSEERYSPPPLPPGVELSPTHTPPIPFLADTSSDRYLPLSTPPSPFISEEEYLESLLSWRLRHLSYVQLKEAEASRRQKHLESDKVSEISSEEHEADFNGGKDDDRMSLSSLSSVAENIEEVTIPSNPYGSYYGEVAHHAYSHSDSKLSYASEKWRDYSDRMYHSYHVPYHPLHPPPMHHAPYHAYLPPEPEPIYEGDPFEYSVNVALEKVCELLTATLEKDLMKRMTEVLAFNEFEAWWQAQETKYKEERKEPEKDKEIAKDETVGTDALLNALVDSNYDVVTSGFSLGFRAALPKMPSFRKKRLPSPSHRDRDLKFTKERRNESDEEEMVQFSDSESQGNEPESMMRRKREEESSSESSDSESLESYNESPADSSETESEVDEIMKSRDDFLAMIDSNILEGLREKTPEPCVTPVPSEDFSDVEDEPKSPGGSQHLKQYAMEALVALGLDEFVSDVKIKKGRTRRPSLKAEAIPSTSKTTPVDSPVKKKLTPVKRKKIETNRNDLAVGNEIKAEKMEIKGEIDSEGTLSPPGHLISVEHSYSKPKPEKQETKPAVASWVLDHDYTASQTKSQRDQENLSVRSTIKERKKKSEKLVSHLIDAYVERVPKRQPKRYPQRTSLQEVYKCFEFLTNGIDEEDIRYLKRGFEGLLTDDSQSYWLQDMHWSDHPATDISSPSKYSKGNETGCARTQGFYKLDPKEKLKMKYHYGKNKHNSNSTQQAATEAKVWTAASREARSNQRRLLTAFGAVTDSDLLKFNQLKFRKKLLKFGKSEIHDWGLFALEPIAADEMVIEYVGQKVRPMLADYREQKYMKRGIGSSYLFRIDVEHIVDATHCGNLSRFINHSCNPNCYAKIITIEGEKKIVIYSKRDIKVDEEITYDYKFPLEEEKIPCLCGDAQCKGFLN